MTTFSNRQQVRAASVAVRRRFESAALYGALGLISAVVFGTLSVHPF